MSDTAQTLLRSVLKIGGGYLIARGVTTEANLEIATAGVMVLAGIVWGLLHRTNKPS